MTNHDQRAFLLARAAYFHERARSYDAIGMVNIARELRDVAHNFEQAADWLNQPWIRDAEPETVQADV